MYCIEWRQHNFCPSEGCALRGKLILGEIKMVICGNGGKTSDWGIPLAPFPLVLPLNVGAFQALHCYESDECKFKRTILFVTV